MPASGCEDHNETLGRLAEALDVPPDAFSDQTVCDLEQTTELMRLWHKITDTQDRAKVLAFVGAVSSRRQASGEPLVLAHAMQKPEDGS